jgi:hypothetical protein
MVARDQLHALAALLGKNPGTHQIGGWMGPTTGADILEKRYHLLLLGFKPILSNHPSHCNDYTILAPISSPISSI